MNNSRKSTTRRFFERLLLFAGLACGAASIAAMVGPSFWQNWEKWTFERQVRGQDIAVSTYVRERWDALTSGVRERLGIAPAEPAEQAEAATPAPATPAEKKGVKPRRPQTRQLVGRLAIPRLGVDTTVREGSDDRTLSLAAGHVRGTALPGEKGNVAVAGHRDTVFRRLSEVRMKDRIRFETLEGDFTYEVASISVVKPQETEVLKAGKHAELTLVTCFPFEFIGSAPERFIVKARLVEETPNQRQEAQPTERPVTQPKPAVVRAAAESKPEPPIAAPAPATAPTAAQLPHGSIRFSVGSGHSQQLTPNISLGISETNLASRTVDGWVWVMPERRTIWLRGLPKGEPVVFYQDGRRHELHITAVSAQAAGGYIKPDAPQTASRRSRVLTAYR